MSFFANIDDELLGQLCKSYGKIFSSIGDLTELLDMDNYKEMADSHERRRDLFSKQQQLDKKLKLPLKKTFPDKPDPEVIEVFLTSYLVAELYPDSVGKMSEIATSIPLVTLPMFKATSSPKKQRREIYNKACEYFGVDRETQKRIKAEFNRAKDSLALRRSLIDEIRKMVLTESGDVVAKPKLKKLFDQFFPDNPLLEEDVDVIVTRTCLYWSLPSKEVLSPRSAAETKKVLDWLSYTNRFAFQYFSHFPTFSSFDSRDSDPKLINKLSKNLGWRRTETINRLNAATTIEKTDQIEKYLIHDTWGHIWQGDLTGLAQLYDAMESLKSPVDCNEHFTLPDGDVVSLLDTTYLNSKGQLEFNEELAVDYVDHWLRIRVRCLLAPIVAELTADSIEYKFKLDNREQADLLPSSSIFADHPTKLDFAWVDIGYFIRTLKRVNLAYSKNQELRENLIDRMVILLKAKYPRQYKAIESKKWLREQVSEVVNRFCDLLEERQDLHLDQDLANQTVDNPNGFFLLFTNLLRLQFTLNHLIQRHLEPKQEDTCEAFNVMMIFVARYFVANPLTNFWNLDETIADYGLPICEMVLGEELE